ncbi:MAG: hypothetical protein NTV15_05585, partial [Candidatus Bathyarchaeota archaeon]|nr:hypothetical protein [Candidatus Bathyarchaeota archaeon]
EVPIQVVSTQVPTRRPTNTTRPPTTIDTMEEGKPLQPHTSTNTRESRNPSSSGRASGGSGGIKVGGVSSGNGGSGSDSPPLKHLPPLDVSPVADISPDDLKAIAR